jgi:hypothetical protein
MFFNVSVRKSGSPARILGLGALTTMLTLGAGAAPTRADKVAIAMQNCVALIIVE